MLVLASGAQARPSRLAAPKAPHAFLLRADEPADTSFPRTPAFAWNPVPGALRYQFQLATSSTFRENSIIYSASNLTSPVAAPQLTIPWIDDMLHARVRAIVGSSTTPWSTQFAFDMKPPRAPNPLSSSPGLLRWAPVEGADGYEVWLVDIPGPPRRLVTNTNVLDEREFYTFHPSPAWISTIHWRVRALRRNIGPTQNGLPAVTYGPWSDVYASTNPAFSGGQGIRLIGTLSDTFVDGSSGSAHKLMPGFVWSGDQTYDGRSAELFRVYVFTDSTCLNRVFTSAVVGSPAYAPRPLGPLQLPRDAPAIATARAGYLADGAEPTGYTFDGDPVIANELLAAPSPTMAVPAADSDSSVGTTATTGASADTPPAGTRSISDGAPSTCGTRSPLVATGGR